jgi:hypothetical protein
VMTSSSCSRLLGTHDLFGERQRPGMTSGAGFVGIMH